MDAVNELRRRRAALVKGGGDERVARQHAAGKLTARERLALLFEPETFQELGLFVRHRASGFGMAERALPGEGVVTGYGLTDGRPVYAASQDFTVAGGTVGEATAGKIHEVMDAALKTGDPFVFINDSAEALGGVESHAHYSGVVHFTAESDPHAIDITRRLLSFLPSNNTEDPPLATGQHETQVVADETVAQVVPEDPREPYDMRHVIRRVFDGGDFLEVQEQFAANIVVGFARLNGYPVGVVANQPRVKAGVLDIDSSDKAARFIRFCNAFNVPLVTFVDVPGFMPGIQQEYGGIIRHGAKMLFAYAASTVPKLTVVVRKAYGGAYLAMCAKSMGADRVCAWPGAEIAVMGAEGAVNVLYRREIAEAADQAAVRARLVAEYRGAFANPYAAAGRGMLDDIIEPADTRVYLAAALELLRAKRELRPQKKHGLIPL